MRLTPGLVLLAVFFIVAGALHFLFPAPYLRIIPPILPWHSELLWISGAAEVCGGLALLLPQTRRAAGYGLALLLIAVFPANVYMAIVHVPVSGSDGRAMGAVAAVAAADSADLVGAPVHEIEFRNPGRLVRGVRPAGGRVASDTFVVIR